MKPSEGLPAAEGTLPLLLTRQQASARRQSRRCREWARRELALLAMALLGPAATTAARTSLEHEGKVCCQQLAPAAACIVAAGDQTLGTTRLSSLGNVPGPDGGAEEGGTHLLPAVQSAVVGSVHQCLQLPRLRLNCVVSLSPWMPR